MADMLIARRPVVVPEVPTLGDVGQHFSRSAIPGNTPPAYSDNVHYFMLGLQQALTIPNISLQGAPPHQTYAGFPVVPTSDRMTNG